MKKPLTEKQKLKLVETYSGKNIRTVYGLSVVVGLTDDKKYVELLEMGIESYLLTIDDFLTQI